MIQRDEQIVSHVALYRVSLRDVLSERFLDGKNPGNVIQRLLDTGRLQARSGLSNRLSYYQITPAEALRQGVPVARSRPLRSQALAQAVAVLWYCCMSEGKHRRLEPAEIAGLDSKLPHMPQAAHCLEETPERRIVRLECVGPQTGVSGLLKRLTERIHSARSEPVLGEWVRSGGYGFVVLADAAGRRRILKKAIEQARLPDIAHVRVEYAPNPATLAAALREIWRNHEPCSRSPESSGNAPQAIGSVPLR